MATPTLTTHTLPGALGPVYVDVRSAARQEPRPAVLLLPGLKGSKDWAFLPPLAERLARGGFSALTITSSGSGVDGSGALSAPDRFGHFTYSAELADLRGVIDALAGGKLGVPVPSGIGLLGHGRGGGVAVLQGARDPRVQALVTWGAIRTVDRWDAATKEDWRSRGKTEVIDRRTLDVLPIYLDLLEEVEREGGHRLDILAAAAQVSVPWLLLHGEEDATVDPAEGERLAAAAPGGSSRLMLVRNGGHAFGATDPWTGPSPEFDQAASATVEWFGKALAPGLR